MGNLSSGEVLRLTLNIKEELNFKYLLYDIAYFYCNINCVSIVTTIGGIYIILNEKKKTLN